MLEACGLSSIDDLFAHLPPGVTLDRELGIPEGLSEMELVSEMRRLSGRNRHSDDLVCFAGDVWEKQGIMRLAPGAERAFRMDVTLVDR